MRGVTQPEDRLERWPRAALSKLVLVVPVGFDGGGLLSVGELFEVSGGIGCSRGPR